MKPELTHSEDRRIVRLLYRDNRRAMRRGLEALRRENRMLKAWGEYISRNCALRTPHSALVALCFLCCLLFNSGCRTTTPNLPTFDYEQEQTWQNHEGKIMPPASALRTPHSALPPPSALPTRLWSAQWTPWSCPVPAVIFVQWSSNLSGPWLSAGTFPVETSSGNLTTPMSENNYFRTGYTLTR